MNEINSRSELLWGKDFQKTLSTKHVAIIGLGGVGSYACEALVRSGVGKVTLIDFDEVSVSNINRQIIAMQSTIGKKKTQSAKERALDINPKLEVRIIDSFYSSELNDELFSEKIDFVVDAIDTMKSKIELLEYCHKEKMSVISSLGAGNRLIPEKMDIVDLKDIKTKKCNFTKNILYQLKKRNITEGIPFVTSDEPPIKVNKVEHIEKVGDMEFKKISPGSVAFVPSVSGLIMAGYVIRSFMNE